MSTQVEHDWPALLAEHEKECERAAQTGALTRRALVAGYAHIDRLAIDGGPVTVEPRRAPRRRYLAALFGIICVGLAALGGGTVLYGLVGG